MSGNLEFGTCDVCGRENYLTRTYWNYNIKCECHSSQHFEMSMHCSTCIPKEPYLTKVTFKTETLQRERE